MFRRPPGATGTCPVFPYTTLFRAVKLRGGNVGEVSGVGLRDDGRARVKLFIDGDVRVPADALASIEPLSIFGPKFVRIDPGEHEGAGPFLEDGGEITRTQTPRELPDIRSEERRVGKECVSTWRSRGSPDHKKKK